MFECQFKRQICFLKDIGKQQKHDSVLREKSDFGLVGDGFTIYVFL